MSKPGANRFESMLARNHDFAGRTLEPGFPLAAFNQLQAWQQQRLGCTFADLNELEHYRPAIDFFLTEVYGGLDFRERDEDMGQVMRALAFATHKHRDQRRKDECASPYINHPLALVDVLVHEGGDAAHQLAVVGLVEVEGDLGKRPGQQVAQARIVVDHQNADVAEPSALVGQTAGRDRLGREVDLCTPDFLSPHVRERVLEEAEPLYEAA